MNKTLIVSSLLAGTVGLGWLTTTWYSSQQMQGYYQQYFKEYNANTLSPVSVKLTSFKQGFLHSRANWEISLILDPCQPKNSTVLTGYDEITHGFLPSLGWATIDTHIIWPDAIEPVLHKMFAKQEPLKIHSQIGFLGNIKTDIESPVASWQSATNKIDWQGLKGNITYNHQRDLVNFKLNVPHISMQGLASNTDQIIVQQLDYTGEQEAKRSLLPVGQSTFKIKQIQANIAQQQLSVQGINLSNHNQLKQHAMSAEANYQVKEILLNQRNIGNFKTRLLLSQLNEQALQQSYMALNKLQQQCHPSSEQIWQVAAPIIKQGFELNLTDTELELFQGKAQASAQIKLPPNPSVTAPNQLSQLFTSMQLTSNVDVSQQLIAGIFTQISQLKGQAMSTAEANSMVQMMLQGMVDQGYILKTPTSYQTNISLLQGKLRINTKAISTTPTLAMNSSQ